MLDTTYPLSDAQMVYNFKKHRYILTESYVLNELGIDLVEKMGGVRSTDVVTAINVLLDTRISLRIYSLIYSHNDKKFVEYVLAKSPSARQMLLDAMTAQLVHLLTYGEGEEENKWLSPDAYNVLLTPIEDTGKSALYRWYRSPILRIPSYEEGNY